MRKINQLIRNLRLSLWKNFTALQCLSRKDEYISHSGDFKEQFSSTDSLWCWLCWALGNPHQQDRLSLHSKFLPLSRGVLCAGRVTKGWGWMNTTSILALLCEKPVATWKKVVRSVGIESAKKALLFPVDLNQTERCHRIQMSTTVSVWRLLVNPWIKRAFFSLPVD